MNTGLPIEGVGLVLAILALLMLGGGALVGYIRSIRK